MKAEKQSALRQACDDAVQHSVHSRSAGGHHPAAQGKRRRGVTRRIGAEGLVGSTIKNAPGGLPPGAFAFVCYLGRACLEGGSGPEVGQQCRELFRALYPPQMRPVRGNNRR